MLNMPGGTQTAPGAPPRLMSVTDATGWAASAEAKGRGKSTALILGLLVVIGLIVVVAAISLKKPPRPVGGASSRRSPSRRFPRRSSHPSRRPRRRPSRRPRPNRR